MKTYSQRRKEFAIIVVGTVVITMVALSVARCSAQTSIIGTVGGASAGLGSGAGAIVGFDLEIRRKKLEFASRLTVDLANKIGSTSGGQFSERAIVRYGEKFLIGGGIGLFHVRAAFGSRTAVSPLIQVAYRYAPTERQQVLVYATIRPVEFGTSYTAEHKTRGVEMGAEFTQTRGRLIFREAFGVEALSYHNLDNAGQRSGAFAFARFGMGVRF